MPEIDLEKLRREEVRWRVLRVLDAGRPMPVSETLLLTALTDIKLELTPHELRREMDYLRDRGTIEILGEDGSVWSANLTRLGVDLVEYTIPCEPGIARPARR